MPHQCPTNDERKTNDKSQVTKWRLRSVLRHLRFVIRLYFVIGGALVGHWWGIPKVSREELFHRFTLIEDFDWAAVGRNQLLAWIDAERVEDRVRDIRGRDRTLRGE